MNIILLIACVFTLTGQSVFRKQYNKKIENEIFCFNAISSLFAMLFFLIPSLINGFAFDKGILIYSALFALAYLICTVTLHLAILWGPFGITSLISSFSIVIPAVFAIIFLKEKITSLIIVGLVMLIISLFLSNSNGLSAEKVSVKWVIVMIFAFFSNGMCSVVQNLQLIKYEHKYKNEFMFFALLAVVIAFVFLTFIKDKVYIKESIKKGVLPAAACGICNGATNLLVMLSLAVMPSSVFFPVLSAGGVICSFVFSLFLYKETLSKKQTLGVIIGIVAIILLNI